MESAIQDPVLSCAQASVEFLSETTHSMNKESSHTMGLQWVPIALRWYFLCIPILLSFITGLSSILLYWKSQENEGLCAETSAIFGWKFIPTLVTVIYTRFTAILLENVQQTEPFVRMAKPSSSVPGATYTILEKPRQWWITLANGLRKHRNGGTRSWVVVICCIVHVLAILVVSPLSAALLGTMVIQRTVSSIPMNRAVPNEASTLTFQTDRGTYLRTTAALLQNYSSSPWVTDDYFVLPFWPSDLGDIKWSPRYSTPQRWRAETHIFRTDFECSRLELDKTDFYLRHWTQFEHDILTTQNGSEGFQYFLASMQLQAGGGCTYNLTFNATAWTMYTNIQQYSSGVASWAEMNSFSDRSIYDEDVHIILGDQCRGDESIILSTAWCPATSVCKGIPKNISAVGYVCSSSYSIAKMAAQASLTETSFVVEFDEDEFHRVGTHGSLDMLNLSQIRKLTLASEFYSYVPPQAPPSSGGGFGNNGWNRPPFQGATALLSALYSQNLTAMINDPDLPQQAARMRRRFFGEMLQTTFAKPEAISQPSIEGTKIIPERRIVVSLLVAPIICGISCMSFVMLIAVAWLSGRHRQLNSFHNLNTIAGILSLVASNQNLLSKFQTFGQHSRKDLKLMLKDAVFVTSPGVLFQIQSDKEPLIPAWGDKTPPRHIKPFIQRKRVLLGLLCFLISLQIVLGVVYHYADASSLSASFFTYRIYMSSTGTLDSVSPFLIIPTLCAVIVAMWWDAIEKSCRVLQPLSAMSKEPTTISKGLDLSYSSSLWLWSSIKAARNKHWILALITIGSFLAQALTVTLSTIFEQSDGFKVQNLEVQRSLEVRRNPHIYPVEIGYRQDPLIPDYQPESDRYLSVVLEDNLESLESNWLYTALIEALYDGPEPTWSKDDWNFVPIDMANLQDSATKYGLKDNSRKSGVSQIQSATNLTIDTTAIRARINCSYIEEAEHPDQWISLLDSDATLARYEFPKGEAIYLPNKTMFPGTDHWTTITSQFFIPICCKNESSMHSSNQGSSTVALGYWTMNYPRDLSPENDSPLSSVGNFTVKWIRGSASFLGEVQSIASEAMYFSALPDIQALNCLPVIESAKATVTVDLAVGHVQGYRILEDTQTEDVAWSDAFVLRGLSKYDAGRNLSGIRIVEHNLTTSYGHVFMNALLRASNQGTWAGTLLSGLFQTFTRETNTTEAYKIHDENKGLNVDFMSYVSYKRSGHDDAAAMLDQQTLLEESQATFSLFFKHFVNSGMSPAAGGWAYQPFGAKLNIEPAVQQLYSRYMNRSLVSQTGSFLPTGDPAPRFEDVPPHNLSRETTGVLKARVEILRLNKVAFWLAVGFLIWLTIIMVVFVCMQESHSGGIVRDVECVADVLILVAGSERLLALVREKGMDTIMREDKIYTRLGWFHDANGEKRWGIEVVETADDEGVELLSGYHIGRSI